MKNETKIYKDAINTMFTSLASNWRNQEEVKDVIKNIISVLKETNQHEIIESTIKNCINAQMERKDPTVQEKIISRANNLLTNNCLSNMTIVKSNALYNTDKLIENCLAEEYRTIPYNVEKISIGKPMEIKEHILHSDLEDVRDLILFKTAPVKMVNITNFGKIFVYCEDGNKYEINFVKSMYDYIDEEVFANAKLPKHKKTK